MLYQLLADIVVLFHTFWTLFLVIGAWWGLRYKAVRVVHLLGLVYAGVTVPFDAPCPLSTLRLWLLERYNPHTTYTGHFIAFYADRLLHIDLPFRFVEVSTIFLCFFNFWLYFGKKAAPLRHHLGSPR